jgi:hypothetical protein
LTLIRSRASFGLAVGALLGALLVAAADTGPLAAAALSADADHSVFSSYMTAQLVWLVAAAVGVVGYVLSRLARRLPASPSRLTGEVVIVAVACVALLSSVNLLTRFGVIGMLTYSIGRWLDIHPVAAQRPDLLVYASLAAGFLLVWWRPSF